MKRTILHVDMDAFYASVEVLRDPTLAGKPVIVGGDGPRGVVASCSYEARAFGIRSAMASVHAKRLCPDAVFLHGDHGLYGRVSAQIHEVFARFTPFIEPIALDEAFLDVTGAQRLFGDGPTTAGEVRRQVYEATQLWCSVGVASNKLLAKLASKEAKPAVVGSQRRVTPGIDRHDGIAVVREDEKLAFLHSLPVRALWGVGPKTFERLSRYGVGTIADLATLPEETLVSALGDARGRHLAMLARGHDDRPVEPDLPTKSVGHEETFSDDHHSVETLDPELLRLCDATVARLRRAGLRGRTVQIKVKTADFRTFTRARTLARPVASLRPVHETARELLHGDDMVALVGRLGVRLLGVAVSSLVTDDEQGGAGTATIGDGEQLDLFGSGDRCAELPAPRAAALATSSDPEVQERLAEAVEAVRSRFGADALGPATLARDGRLRVKREGDTQWGPRDPG